MTPPTDDIILADDPLWFQKSIIYQVHVRGFADSNGDGIGDFRGLTGKLDYIHDLGATAIWVLPFYPSPLRDAGYDIADYRGVNPEYGTIRDVRRFVKEAHARGIRVITELVLNHTSDQHPWFQRARRAAPDSKWRNFYVWSDTPERYKGTRIIFRDYEQSNWTWDPVAKAYFWHRFYHHQPDLNWDNPAVQKEMFRIVDFWLDMGIDGLRLDAVPYLIEREGTTCENLSETHDILKKLRSHVDARYENRMLLAEANQWPEDACAYFGEGDECHMNFHFPLMPRLFMAIQTAERFPVIDILEQTPRIPENCQWAVFLRNHDELTLEMVTDEERDYMYRKYAADPRARINLGIRRRLAPLLGNDRRKIELVNGLLLSLAGTPIIYYGDEIGMGDNIYLGDRDGVRTPMQWSADRNAGFSHANPQRLYLPVNIDPEYRYEAINVETQQHSWSSLYWWMKRAIALRHRYPVFGTGEVEFLFPDNPKVLVYLRHNEEQVVLVVANLAPSVQYVELDLAAFEGRVPLEILGGTRFPRIGELPYFLTLGPHAFYWFDLADHEAAVETEGLPVIRSDASFEALFSGRRKQQVQKALVRALPTRRWFAGKARAVDSVELVEVISDPKMKKSGGAPFVVTIARVHYREGDPEDYVVPLAWAEGGDAARVAVELPDAPLIEVQSESRSALLFDAMYDSRFPRWLVEIISDRRSPVRGRGGELCGVRSRRHRSIRGSEPVPEGTLLQADQSNTAVLFGDRMFLKLFRRLQGGVNPDYEISSRLTESGRFTGLPPVAGAVEYQPKHGEAGTIAVLQGYVFNEGNAWQLTLDHVERFLATVLENPEDEVPLDLSTTDLTLAQSPPSPAVAEVLGSYAVSAEIIGERTAEMHAALAAETEDPAFAPEEFTGHYLRGLFQGMRNQTATGLAALRKAKKHLEEPVASAARTLLDSRQDILDQMKEITRASLSGMRIRCHGDYHLGQVLNTGPDFIIIDFEGEPARSIGARKLKQNPLRDVAGMLRSFDYAAQASVLHLVATGSLQEDSEAEELARNAARMWALYARAAFLRGYLRVAHEEPFLPGEWEERAVLLRAFVLEKAMYELEYELNNRPDWVAIPIAGILDLLEESE